MREDVYNYLHDYGFSAIDLDNIEKINENMFSTNVSEVRKNISFLEEKYLDYEDIINLINDNPFMLTEKNNRLEAIDNIYDSLQFDYESLKKLIKNNPKAYTLSPIELEKIIEYLNSKNVNKEGIKKLILQNPKVISMKFVDFEKAINNN